MGLNVNNPIQTKCSLGSQIATKTNNSEGVELIDGAFNADFSCSSWIDFLVLNLLSSCVISRRFSQEGIC